MPLFRTSPSKQYGPILIERLPVGVSVYRLDEPGDDASLRLVFSNTAADQITGLKTDDEVGRRFVEIMPEIAGTPMLAACADVARSGESRSLGVVQYGDARVAETSFRVEVVGLPDHSVGIVFEDMSEMPENALLRTQSTALAREEVRYRTLVEATAAIVWTTDPSGAITEDQPSWRAFTGQSVAEHLGDGWAEAVHPDDRVRTVEVWSEAVRLNKPYALSHRMRRHDGEYRLMSARGTPVIGADGQIVEWVGVHTDVEEQNEATLALAASESRFQTLFDALADPVLVYPLGTDGPEALVAFNRAAVDLYGYSEDELRAMTITDLVAPGSISVPGALDELRRTRRATFDSTHQTRDGRTVPMQTSARLVQHEGRLCVLALARDDSERRAFQRELSRSNLGLERTVEARTSELQAFADALKVLHRITTQEFDSPEARTDAYLHAGCEMFDLPVGILSATPLDPETGERLYRIESVVSPDPSLAPGLTVPISEAFCDAVLERGETVVYGDAADVEALACHPAYATRGLRAFIGTPIRIDGEIVGTLNFVSPQARSDGFRASERDLIEIMADAVARRIVADQAERARRETEDYYRTIVDTVEEGIVTLDAECRITMSNPSARILLGLEPEAGHDGGPVTDGRAGEVGALVPASEGSERGGNTLDLAERWLVVDADRNPIPAHALPERRVLDTGEPVRGEIQGIVHPSGLVRWYRVNAAPIDHDGDGRPEAVVLSFADVTEMQEATHRGDAALRLRRDAVRLAQVGAWSWDVSADTVEWSTELYGLLGVTEADFEPSFAGYLSLVAEPDRARLGAAVEAALAGEHDSTFALAHGVAAPGASRLLCHGEVIRNAHGEPVRVVGSAQPLDGRAGSTPPSGA